jgi:hypothetical protein
MFPDAKKFLAASRLVELGAAMAARKKQLENHPTVTAPTRAPSSTPSAK